MKTEVTYDNGEVFQHFGHTEYFKLYDIDGTNVSEGKVVPTNGSGHGALAGFLKALGVEALICGGIGGGAKAALADAGITLYCGVQGSADEAARALANGTLNDDPDTVCEHHSHEHGSCGEHSCGGHSCG